MIATSHNSPITAGIFFRSKSIPTTTLSATAVGEVFYVAKVYAELVYEISNMAISWRSLVALVSGSGIEVTVDREGRGERNAESFYSR